MNKKNQKQKQKPPLKKSLIDQWVGNLEISKKNVKDILGKSADFVSKSITINKKSNIIIHMFYIDGLVNHQYLSDLILKPLVNDVRLVNVEDEDTLFDYIEQGAVYFSAQKTFSSMVEVVEALLSGNAVFVFDGLKKAVSFDAKGFQMRSITRRELMRYMETTPNGTNQSFFFHGPGKAITKAAKRTISINPLHPCSIKTTGI